MGKPARRQERIEEHRILDDAHLLTIRSRTSQGRSLARRWRLTPSLAATRLLGRATRVRHMPCCEPKGDPPTLRRCAGRAARRHTCPRCPAEASWGHSHWPHRRAGGCYLECGRDSRSHAPPLARPWPLWRSRPDLRMHRNWTGGKAFRHTLNRQTPATGTTSTHRCTPRLMVRTTPKTTRDTTPAEVAISPSCITHRKTGTSGGWTGTAPTRQRSHTIRPSSSVQPGASQLSPCARPGNGNIELRQRRPLIAK